MAKEIFSTQALIPIQEIRRGVVVLKDGSVRSILEVSAINLSLKSSEEQELILQGWRQLLNDLDFSFQVVTHSYRVDINPYLLFLRDRIEQEQNELLKTQGEDYYNFLNALVKENSIMKKNFYVVIPYNPVVISKKTPWINLQMAIKKLINLNRGSFSSVITLPPEKFEQYYQQLMIRQATIISSLTRLGLEARPLETKELIALFYNLYNPRSAHSRNLSLNNENE